MFWHIHKTAFGMGGWLGAAAILLSLHGIYALDRHVGVPIAPQPMVENIYGCLQETWLRTIAKL